MYKVLLASVLAVVGLSVSACGGGSGSGAGGGAYGANPPVMNNPVPIATSSPAVAPSNSPVTTTTGFAGDVKQANVNGVTILVDATSGLALYTFDHDASNQSNCTGSCLAIWPAHAAAASEKGSNNFSIFTRSDGGGLQWSYKNRPLYTFAADTVAHNATGAGVQNFHLATP